MCVSVCIYIYACVCVCMCIYIYIYVPYINTHRKPFKADAHYRGALTLKVGMGGWKGR